MTYPLSRRATAEFVGHPQQIAGASRISVVRRVAAAQTIAIECRRAVHSSVPGHDSGQQQRDEQGDRGAISELRVAL